MGSLWLDVRYALRMMVKTPALTAVLAITLALGLGLPAIFLRGRALRGPLDAAGLTRVLRADSVWGIAAALWLVTGVLRAFAGLVHTGADRLIDFNCVSTQEKGMCPGGCHHDLRDDVRRLSERRPR